MANDKPTSSDITTARPAGSVTAPLQIEEARPSLGLRVWRMVWGTPSTSQAAGQPVDGTREVIETVVFVVVLVLMLKSFVAEAFVIPTGSMAETLWGYQKVVTCPQCEFSFPVNCSSEVEPQEETGRTVPVTSCTCPNCRLDIELVPENQSQHLAPNQVVDPGWSTGDRVLVAKFLYDLLGRQPDRFDTVVFKYPGDTSSPPPRGWPVGSGPQKNHVPMNYIKRLIGFPGETIAIHGGDLYASPPDLTRYQEEDFADCPDEASREARKRLLWQTQYMHRQPVGGVPSEQALREQLRDGSFRIIRKDPEEILAMKRIVYDNEHQARDLEGQLPPRWQPGAGSGWVSLDTSFQHTPQDGVSWLRYHHLLRHNNGKPQLITDFMGYNSGSLLDPTERWVGDLVLESEVSIDGEQGELILELSQGVDRFQAVFDVGSGVCQLYRVTDGQRAEKPLQTAEAGLKGPGTYQVRFANVDRQLLVWVDGRLPFGEVGVVYDAPETAGPTAENDLEPASIGVSGAVVTVRKLRLWRDTYYTTSGGSSEGLGNVDLTSPDSWGPLRRQPVRTYYVQPDHYFCLGDNSPQSSDGRTWGLVPRRLLLGKAVVVYYPFKFPWWPISAKFNRVGLID